MSFARPLTTRRPVTQSNGAVTSSSSSAKPEVKPSQTVVNSDNVSTTRSSPSSVTSIAKSPTANSTAAGSSGRSLSAGSTTSGVTGVRQRQTPPSTGTAAVKQQTGSTLRKVSKSPSPVPRHAIASPSRPAAAATKTTSVRPKSASAAVTAGRQNAVGTTVNTSGAGGSSSENQKLSGTAGKQQDQSKTGCKNGKISNNESLATNCVPLSANCSGDKIVSLATAVSAEMTELCQPGEKSATSDADLNSASCLVPGTEAETVTTADTGCRSSPSAVELPVQDQQLLSATYSSGSSSSSGSSDPVSAANEQTSVNASCDNSRAVQIETQAGIEPVIVNSTDDVRRNSGSRCSEQTDNRLSAAAENEHDAVTSQETESIDNLLIQGTVCDKTLSGKYTDRRLKESDVTQLQQVQHTAASSLALLQQLPAGSSTSATVADRLVTHGLPSVKVENQLQQQQSVVAASDPRAKSVTSDCAIAGDSNVLNCTNFDDVTSNGLSRCCDDVIQSDGATAENSYFTVTVRDQDADSNSCRQSDSCSVNSDDSLDECLTLSDTNRTRNELVDRRIIEIASELDDDLNRCNNKYKSALRRTFEDSCRFDDKVTRLEEKCEQLMREKNALHELLAAKKLECLESKQLYKTRVDSLENELARLKMEKCRLLDRLQLPESERASLAVEEQALAELRHKLEEAEDQIDNLKVENAELKQDLRDVELAMCELHDQFQAEESIELRELQRELENTSRDCRLLHFKLRKAERRNEQLQNDYDELQLRTRNLTEDRRRVHQLEQELCLARDVSIRLHDEIERLTAECQSYKQQQQQQQQQDSSVNDDVTRRDSDASSGNTTTPNNEKGDADSQSAPTTTTTSVCRNTDSSTNRLSQGELQLQLSLAEQEIDSLQRKVNEMTTENKDLMKAVSYLRSKLECRDAAESWTGTSLSCKHINCEMSLSKTGDVIKNSDDFVDSAVVHSINSGVISNGDRVQEGSSDICNNLQHSMEDENRKLMNELKSVSKINSQLETELMTCRRDLDGMMELLRRKEKQFSDERKVLHKKNKELEHVFDVFVERRQQHRHNWEEDITATPYCYTDDKSTQTDDVIVTSSAITGEQGALIGENGINFKKRLNDAEKLLCDREGIICDLKKLIHSKDVYLNETLNTVNDLKATVRRLRETVTDKDKQLTERKTELNALLQQLADVRRQLDGVNETIDSLKQRLSDSQQSIQTLSHDLQVKVSEAESMSAQVRQLSLRVEDDVIKLKAAAETEIQLRAELKKSREQIEELQGHVTSARAACELQQIAAKNDRSLLEEKIQKLTSENESILDELRRFNAKLAAEKSPRPTHSQQQISSDHKTIFIPIKRYRTPVEPRETAKSSSSCQQNQSPAANVANVTDKVSRPSHRALSKEVKDRISTDAAYHTTTTTTHKTLADDEPAALVAVDQQLLRQTQQLEQPQQNTIADDVSATPAATERTPKVRRRDKHSQQQQPPAAFRRSRSMSEIDVLADDQLVYIVEPTAEPLQLVLSSNDDSDNQLMTIPASAIITQPEILSADCDVTVRLRQRPPTTNTSNTFHRGSFYASGTLSVSVSRDQSPDRRYASSIDRPQSSRNRIVRRICAYPVPPPNMIITPSRTPHRSQSTDRASALRTGKGLNTAELIQRLSDIVDSSESVRGRSFHRTVDSSPQCQVQVQSLKMFKDRSISVSPRTARRQFYDQYPTSISHCHTVPDYVMTLPLTAASSRDQRDSSRTPDSETSKSDSGGQLKKTKSRMSLLRLPALLFKKKHNSENGKYSTVDDVINSRRLGSTKDRQLSRSQPLQSLSSDTLPTVTSSTSRCHSNSAGGGSRLAARLIDPLKKRTRQHQQQQQLRVTSVGELTRD